MASSTVELGFTGHPVPAGRVTATLPLAQWATGTRPACARTGRWRSAWPRGALEGADPASMPAARAAACELALRATAALVVSQGSTAILADQDAQRLAREALFLLVFGSRPPIKQALAGLLTRPLG